MTMQSIETSVAVQTRIVEPGAAMPVLGVCDVLVVESSLAGCVCAWLLAREGKRVMLVTTDTSLGRELVVVRQPWSDPATWSHLPDAFAQALRRSIDTRLESGVVLLNLSRLAVELEDLLLDEGVRIFFGQKACAVSRDKDRITGVVFGGKCGLQLVRCQAVVDASIAADVARLANAPVRWRVSAGQRVHVHVGAKVKASARPGPVVITRGQMSDDRLVEVVEDELQAPGVEELPGGRIPLYGPFAKITLNLPVDGEDPLWLARLSVRVRQALVDVGQAVQQARAEAGLPAIYFHRFAGSLMLDPVVRIDAVGADAPWTVAAVGNLHVLGAGVDVEDDIARQWVDPCVACINAQDVADAAAASMRRDEADVALGRLSMAEPEAMASATDGRLDFADAPSLHATEHEALPARLSLPVVARAQVLVAGGGTAGVPCSLAAAKEGARTILLEQHADVGGVRTIGGVGSYWFGKNTPFVQRCDQAYDRVIASTGLAEEGAMMACLVEAGVEVLSPMQITGAVHANGRVLGVVVVTAQGLGLIEADVVVDATGDADVAAWAGAAFAYGNGRDALTLWGSFGSFNASKRTSNRQYESTIEVRDPWDMARTIVRGRRRPGMWQRLDHEMPQHYVTPRESRRIVADAQVTYSGILAGETFEDVMVVCESNFDIKGISSSDIHSCGVVSSWDVYEKFEAAVPWRAIQPRGLTNVVVAGRCYNASHDAIALARMQKDMVNMGGAAGVAAARSAAQGAAFADLDVTSLQARWREEGMVKEEDFKRYARPWVYAARQAQADVSALLRRRGKWNLKLARLMRAAVSLPELQRAYDGCTHPLTQVRLARALCFHGDGRGVPVLLASIASQISKGLPRPMKKHLAVPPEHCWAGEPVYSLCAIGLCGEGLQALPVMSTIARMIEDNAERFGSKTDSQFEYVLAICRVAERCVDAAMLPPLRTLRNKRCLQGLAIAWRRDQRMTVDPVPERRAYLELCIARAMARCGDVSGYETLARYSDDVRGTLSRSATMELEELLDGPWPRGEAERARLLASAGDRGVQRYMRITD